MRNNRYGENKMRSVIWAFIIVFLLITLVLLNSIIISYNIKEVISRLEDTPNEISAADKYLDIRDDFIKIRKYISLTVNHEDISEIDSEFAELSGILTVGDAEELVIAKSRLINALLHLKRLSGINLESIL
ncbi:MAG: DUF4363 family protein [Ruminococcaceae bacterium]|nr:DUF4363 family protein [Oscillospiraceae bacterium]